MSYGLMIYSVDLDKIKEICGSGNDQTRRAISGRFRERIYSTNDHLGYSNERGEPSIFEAIRHLIMGGEMNLDGAMYGYAYKYIVGFYGKFLDNNRFMPCSYEYLTETLNENLKKIGISLDLMNLAASRSPIAFPRPDDFPLFGYWAKEEIQKNLPILQNCKHKTEENTSIQEWLETAVSKNEEIVGFWH
jgi:hypothetical protein